MIKIRPANTEDLDSIISLYEAELLRTANPTFIKTSIQNYPVFVAEEYGNIVGFVYCRQFSPDILEPANILVKATHRNNNIGSLLLAEVEKAAKPKYASLILVNSTLHKENENKRDASNFYLRQGFNIILKTPGSTVFSKELI